MQIRKKGNLLNEKAKAQIYKPVYKSILNSVEFQGLVGGSSYKEIVRLRATVGW